MNRIALTLALAAGITCAAFGYEPQRHNGTYTTNGITYAQRGGLGASDYVVTNIDAAAVGKVKSVNTKTGDVVLDAQDVGALPLVEDANNNKTAVTIGRRTGNVGENSLANGYGVVASGAYSHAEGVNATASGNYSHAEGFLTTASGDYSHAEGYYATASGNYSHAEGSLTTASGDCSHAEGYYAHTKKQDSSAFAWNGDETRTTPYESHGSGTFNINPVGGMDGFYIGEQTIHAILTNKADKAEVDSAIHAVREDNEQTRQIVTTWENFLDGSNVVFSITNYLSGTYSLDAAKMTIKELREGEYREVYNSRDEILLHIQDFKDNDLKNATNQVIGAVNAAIENKADRDWGKYTSAGGVAPENTVYITAPKTVFAGGLEYERVAVGEGTICVLTTHGAPVWTQGDEGTFKFQDDGGTNYFGFAKTDSYTIGANTDGITVQSGMVTMNYNITMSGRPCVWYKADLTSNTPWEQLNLPDGSPVAGASHTVTWEQNPPADTQVCYINVGNQPQGFFRATVEVAGEAKFMTNMPADLSGGIICTNTETGVSGVIKPTFNGTTVQWTWSSQ